MSEHQQYYKRMTRFNNGDAKSLGFLQNTVKYSWKYLGDLESARLPNWQRINWQFWRLMIMPIFWISFLCHITTLHSLLVLSITMEGLVVVKLTYHFKRLQKCTTCGFWKYVGFKWHWWLKRWTFIHRKSMEAANLVT